MGKSLGLEKWGPSGRISTRALFSGSSVEERQGAHFRQQRGSLSWIKSSQIDWLEGPHRHGIAQCSTGFQGYRQLSSHTQDVH